MELNPFIFSNIMELKVGQKIELFLSNGFRYVAIVLSEDSTFLWIRDKLQKTLCLNKKDISTIKLIEGEDDNK